MKTVVLSHTAPRPSSTRASSHYAACARLRRRGLQRAAGATRRGGSSGPSASSATASGPAAASATCSTSTSRPPPGATTSPTTASTRITGKVPALVFEHEEKRAAASPSPGTPFDTDDIAEHRRDQEFRVRFDRNRYSVPWRLVGQSVLVRANDDHGRNLPRAQAGGPAPALLGHRRGHRAPGAHDDGVLARKPRAAGRHAAPGLAGLGDVGLALFQGLRRREPLDPARDHPAHPARRALRRPAPPPRAMHEVMATGHVGAEYVEYVLRHRGGSAPLRHRCASADADLDGLAFREPDLSAYDRLVPALMTRDPGDAARPDGSGA